MKYKSAHCEFDGEVLTVHTVYPGRFSVPEKLFNILKEVKVKKVRVINNEYIDLVLNDEELRTYLDKAEMRRNRKCDPPYYLMRYR